ncbi:MAG: hypothetical protein ACI4J0_00285 [Huintestinicola sp.]|uniref:hypothetical protein n=1 Tax=Huintestinicola sp. TaxID=2981661 RepID=UPI003F026515
MSDEYYLGKIDSTTQSTLRTARQVEAAVGAVAAEVALVHRKASVIDGKVDSVRNELAEVDKKVNDIQKMVYTLYDQARRQHLMQMAQTQIVKVRQEREKLYGNYDKIRKTTEGILLATDVGIVRQNTIVTAAEELRLSTPKYWLSSCLVALSAWINDDRATAERAVMEALNIDEEKTSLFFALVCRRAGRSEACNQWMVRYLRGQDPENLDMRCVFMLDAYANGLLGNTYQSSVFEYMNEWVDILSKKDDFEQNQISNWNKIINKCMSMPDLEFKAIEDHCTNHDVYIAKLETAYLHGRLFEYIDGIMSTPVNTGEIKEKLDEILMELVTLFDDDERVKVYEERELEYIIKYNGDEDKAKKKAQIEKSKFEEVRDFTQILSDVAMGGESNFESPSTRKLAVAFCRDWIKSAYNDTLAKNRMIAGRQLNFEVDWFKFSTSDGRNEKTVLAGLSDEITEKRSAEVENAKRSLSEAKKKSQMTYVGWGIAAAVCFLIAVGGASVFFGIATLIAGAVCGFYVHYNLKGCVEEYQAACRNIETKYNDMQSRISLDVRRIFSEVFKMADIVNKKNKEEKLTMQLLDELSPELYVARFEDDKAKTVMLK